MILYCIYFSQAANAKLIRTRDSYLVIRLGAARASLSEANSASRLSQQSLWPTSRASRIEDAPLEEIMASVRSLEERCRTRSLRAVQL